MFVLHYLKKCCSAAGTLVFGVVDVLVEDGITVAIEPPVEVVVELSADVVVEANEIGVDAEDGIDVETC